MGISINDKFGRLLVIKFIERNKHGRKVFECICDCGNVKQITDANLRPLWEKENLSKGNKIGDK